MVDAEVEEALPRNPALPAAAGEVGHQLLRRREAEVQLELQESLPELLRVLLLGRLPAPGLLRYQALWRQRGDMRQEVLVWLMFIRSDQC